MALPQPLLELPGFPGFCGVGGSHGLGCPGCSRAYLFAQNVSVFVDVTPVIALVAPHLACTDMCCSPGS